MERECSSFLAVCNRRPNVGSTFYNLLLLLPCVVGTTHLQSCHEIEITKFDISLKVH
jgi:hypothetical protein